MSKQIYVPRGTELALSQRLQIFFRIRAPNQHKSALRLGNFYGRLPNPARRCGKLGGVLRTKRKNYVAATCERTLHPSKNVRKLPEGAGSNNIRKIGGYSGL